MGSTLRIQRDLRTHSVGHGSVSRHLLPSRKKPGGEAGLFFTQILSSSILVQTGSVLVPCGSLED